MLEFKIRASQAGKIMAGNVGLSESQAKELKGLQDRQSDKNAKPLTEKMIERADALWDIHKSPELPQGAKTYCENWLTEQLYSRRKEIHSKYMDKGNANEDESLDFIAEFFDYGMLLKNEESFEDGFMTGTPDAILKDIVIDVKNSWDCFTFPLFKDESVNKDYYWQAQVYMYLTGREAYKLIYTLTDTPESLITKEAYFYCQRNDFGELDQETYDKFHAHMTYKDIPDELKIKSYYFTASLEDIGRLIKRVKMCREYIYTLVVKNKLLKYLV